MHLAFFGPKQYDLNMLCSSNLSMIGWCVDTVTGSVYYIDSVYYCSTIIYCQWLDGALILQQVQSTGLDETPGDSLGYDMQLLQISLSVKVFDIKLIF